MTPTLAVLILTHNEQLHIERCLRSVAGWANEIFVVDSFSTDRTVEIAQSLGAHVVQHAFQYHAQQKNWALHNLPITGEWLLLLDADEWVPPELRDEILQTIGTDSGEYDGYWMRFRLMFYGKWIRRCGWYPTWILRLVRTSKVYIEDRQLDEHAVVYGPTARLGHDLIHENLRGMADWIAKHNRYSSQVPAITSDHSGGGIQPRFFGSQVQRKRYIKEKIWPHLPGRALLYFLYLYILRLGFLDGRHGLMFCTMRGVFEQFNVAKIWEARRNAAIGELPDPEQIKSMSYD